MKILGVTGGIGSGKTQFCNRLRELGAIVSLADDLAKEIMVSDPQVIHQIRTIFGGDAYFSDGSLNKAYLSEQAFSKGRSEELNQIVHPAVGTYTRKRIEEARTSGCPLFVNEAALLLKNGRSSLYDLVVWIEAPENDRVKRVKKRDGFPEESILERARLQQTLKDVEQWIDVVIHNDSDIHSLRSKAETLYKELVLHS